MNKHLDGQAEAITARVNQRIAAAADDWSPLEYRAQAESIAGELVPADWDWELVEVLGEVPFIVLLRNDPRRADG